MVKGTSRQVILVQAPEPELFEQAIFILKENAESVTDEMLLKEAKRIINSPKHRKLYGPVWACGGALLIALTWLCTILF
jgi:hypothetical protein